MEEDAYIVEQIGLQGKIVCFSGIVERLFIVRQGLMVITTAFVGCGQIHFDDRLVSFITKQAISFQRLKQTRNRLIFPASPAEKTKYVPSSKAAHTGVATATPDFRNVARLT